MEIRPMTRQEVALHGLQADFMVEANPDEWHVLPGATHEGTRLPDVDDGNVRLEGCWATRLREAPDDE